MRVRLGINNCFAAKRWPRAGDWARVIRDDLGLDLVELSLDLLADSPGGLREELVEETRRSLEEHGLRAEATFTGLAAYGLNLLMHPDASARAAALRWYGEVIAISARLGARATGGHVGTMSVHDWGDPSLRCERWSQLKEGLRILAQGARRAGLDRLLIENLVSPREPSTMAQVEDLLEEGDAEHVPVELCLDVGHQCVPGTSGEERDPYAWLRRFGRRCAEVQLQQSDALGDHHWPFTPELNAAGRIDAGRVLDTLAGTGAGKALLILEVIPAWEEDDAEVIEALRTSIDLWRSAIHERGFDDGDG